MRKSITHILKSDESIEVVGTTGDGAEAVRQVKACRPDVVLLDIEMPKMDGLAALAHIMAECPTPVLMLSALDKREEDIAVKSLDHGAVDFISKPSGVISYDIEKLSHDILVKVKIAATITVRRLDLLKPVKALHIQRTGAVPRKRAPRKRVVIIGASTGGPRAIPVVLSRLPRDITTAIIVVQHLSPEFVPSFVERLQWSCSLEISKARSGEALRPGRALIAPGGCHTRIIQNGDAVKIRLSRKKSPPGFFPSIDVAMESAARAYGNQTLGVLLTGLGNDGAKGMKAIKDAGGGAIAEDPSTCVIFGMPKAAIELGCVDEVVPLPLIAETILRRI